MTDQVTNTKVDEYTKSDGTTKMTSKETNDKPNYPTWKGKDGSWHNDRLPTVDDCMTLPDYKSKLDIEEEIKSVLSPNSYIDPSEGIALCKHLNNVIEAEVEKAKHSSYLDGLQAGIEMTMKRHNIPKIIIEVRKN